MLISDESRWADCAIGALPSMVTLTAKADVPAGRYGVGSLGAENSLTAGTTASEARRELVRRMILASRSRFLARRRWSVAARSGGETVRDAARASMQR